MKWKAEGMANLKATVVFLKTQKPVVTAYLMAISCALWNTIVKNDKRGGGWKVVQSKTPADVVDSRGQGVGENSFSVTDLRPGCACVHVCTLMHIPPAEELIDSQVVLGGAAWVGVKPSFAGWVWGGGLREVPDWETWGPRHSSLEALQITGIPRWEPEPAPPLERKSLGSPSLLRPIYVQFADFQHCNLTVHKIKLSLGKSPGNGFRITGGVTCSPWWVTFLLTKVPLAKWVPGLSLPFFFLAGIWGLGVGVGVELY